ncbi:glutathione S-transferase family protein [Microbulbifer bruguierae]|uniref:Glutathione S-transferase family protein n=1 Tax=Microbulbifer bruguierae TaxID=3029061 RepID=A0ABY8NBV0_9GAMM|nr:glutathione S-transferase family protein [Microbulbifer bruguierae]WGL15920.1 glutathione S-transferase family protein [Microbulbifer bruguierae]
MDYRLYYWDLPFRGVFIELLLQEVGAGYQRLEASEIYPERSLKIHNPGMASPYLYDCALKKYFAQMPAIMMYLAEKHELIPKRAETRTLALKTILDCNDILLEITNFHGLKMWDKKSWEAFRFARLSDWMQIFETTGRDHGLQDDKGFMLGSRLSVADIATAALFGTMVYAFPALEEDLLENAPGIAALVKRVEARPAIRPFLEERRETWGRGYCGGQIEVSLRRQLG